MASKKKADQWMSTTAIDASDGTIVKVQTHLAIGDELSLTGAQLEALVERQAIAVLLQKSEGHRMFARQMLAQLG